MDMNLIIGAITELRTAVVTGGRLTPELNDMAHNALTEARRGRSRLNLRRFSLRAGNTIYVCPEAVQALMPHHDPTCSNIQWRIGTSGQGSFAVIKGTPDEVHAALVAEPSP